MKDTYNPLIGTLGYVLSPDLTKVLMIHRNKRKEDPHWGKFNGLGGKLDSGEDIVSGMRREIQEEAGIIATQMQLRGTINWKGFGGEETGSFGFIFLITRFEGEVSLGNHEGDLGWHDLDKIHKLNIWQGDRHFLPLVFDQDPRIFHGFMPYKNDQPQGWSYIRE